MNEHNLDQKQILIEKIRDLAKFSTEYSEYNKGYHDALLDVMHLIEENI